MKKIKDYRKNQKVIATIVLEDKGQDFTEIDVLENGVILGNSIMFENGKLSMIGIGSLDGLDYFGFNVIRKSLKKLNNLYIYLKDTGKPDPLPWETVHLKYKIVGVKKAEKVNRFKNLNK